MADYILQEDGTSKVILEDASGDLLLESSTPSVVPSFIASVTVVHAPTIAHAGSGTILESGTWICPDGITQITVKAWGGGGGGSTGSTAATDGGGGGSFAEDTLAVTPGTAYTVTIGLGGSQGNDGGDTTFTGDTGSVVAKGGKHGTSSAVGQGGQASTSTGAIKFSGGDGGFGSGFGGQGGGGGGAAGDSQAGGAGGNGGGGVGGAGGTGGASGGGAGGAGGDSTSGGTGRSGAVPGGGGAGGAAGGAGGTGGNGKVTITVDLVPSFIPSSTVVYAPALTAAVPVPFIASSTTVYAPTLVALGVDVPFIASKTRVYRIFSLFDPNKTYSGPGNGGEIFTIRLAANGVTETAILAADITATATALELTGDGSLPTTSPFILLIDDEAILVVQLAAGSYRIRGRAMSNTTAAAHTAGATVTWTDSYDMAIRAGSDIAHSFTADINATGSTTYDGWLICFDSSQAYLSGDRYPTHVAEVVGVFDAGAGSTGTNRCDASQPNAVTVPAAVTDDCPAALSNPSRISSDIAAGDVALVRYTNTEASPLDLGSRSAALQSWFGLKRVNATDGDVTGTDPNGYVVDTIPSGGGPGPFTGSVEEAFAEPLPLQTGIAPDASDAAGTPISTPNPVPWVTVTLPGTDRYFTYGSPHYSEKGWPMCCLAVRQGNRRVPFWQSWDWRDYNYVYTGFGLDDTFCQILINRNGIVFDSVPSVDLPGPQDIDGPDVVWDDASYYFAAAWYVVLFSTPYLVSGPSIGGTVSGAGLPGEPGFAPTVTFPGGGGGGGAVVTTPPTVEGGSGGDITPPGQSLFQAAAV